MERADGSSSFAGKKTSLFGDQLLPSLATFSISLYPNPIVGK